MFQALRNLKATFRRPARQTSRPRASWRPNLVALEDRLSPSVSSATVNFDRRAIPAGDWVWFSSQANVNGLPSSAPATVRVTDQTITFNDSGTAYSLNVPNTAVTFDPNATQATTAYANGSWTVTAPVRFSGQVFFAGLAFPVAGGLNGGIRNVKWQGNFTSDTARLTVRWQFSAAVYTSFSGDMSSLGVKTVDDRRVDVYQNRDGAGTPENFKGLNVRGATGTGGNDYTGNPGNLVRVRPSVGAPPVVNNASLSGHVFADANGNGTYDAGEGITGGSVTLGDSLGNPLQTLAADANGGYSFTGLAAGAYTIVEYAPAGYRDRGTTVGSLGGVQDISADGFPMIDVTLTAGAAGTGYDFAVSFSPT